MYHDILIILLYNSAAASTTEIDVVEVRRPNTKMRQKNAQTLPVSEAVVEVTSVGVAVGPDQPPLPLTHAALRLPDVASFLS